MMSEKSKLNKPQRIVKESDEAVWQKRCIQCGQIMERKKKSEAMRDNWKFCSRSCVTKYYNHQRKIPLDEYITGYRKCKNCGKLFPYRKELKKRSNRGVAPITAEFCSQKCAIVWLNKTEKHRKMVAKKNSGENHYNWKGGKSLEKAALTPEWRKWRRTVFERDNYTCQVCGERGVELNPHHLKRVSDYPELKYKIGNGITLCKFCHFQYTEIGGKRKPVFQISKDDVLVKRYISITDAAKMNPNFSASGIERVLKGETNAYKGFRWEYA